MNKLEEARMIINEVDEKMVELFEKRMHAVQNVVAFKKEQGLPVFDEKREQQLIAKNCSFLKDASLKKEYLEFLEAMLAISKNYQKEWLRCNDTDC